MYRQPDGWFEKQGMRDEEEQEQLKFFGFQQRNEKKLHFKLVHERNKRWCVRCHGLKLPSKEF
jgi:hypothetical protein